MITKSYFKYIKNILLSFLLAQSGILYNANAETLNIKQDSIVKKNINFGVFSYLGYNDTYSKYKPIVDYLNSRLIEERIVLKILSMDEIYKSIETNSLDLITTNPTHFLVIREKYKLSGAIATLVHKSKTGVTTSQLGGVIVTKSTRKDINNIEDLKGKIISAPSQENMGGFRSQIYELYNHGIKLGDNLKNLKFSNTHQDAINLLLDGKSDVAFVRTGVVEEMVEKGELNIDKIKIINKKEYQGFPYICSTQLYPEWPTFALPHVNEKYIRHIASALFALDPDNPYAIKSGFYGYTVPSDYLPVEQLARSLRLPPFNQTPNFTVYDIWSKYHLIILLTIIVLILILIIIIFQYIYNKKISNEKRKYKNLLSGLGEGVFGVDKNGKCIFINDTALNHFGFVNSDFENKNFIKVIHNISANENINIENCSICRTINDGIQRSNEDVFYRKDGSFFDVDVIISPMFENEIISGAIIAFRDITQTKLSIEEIRILNRAIEQSPVSIVITDLDGNIEYVNPKFEQVTGYTFDEIKLQNPRILQSGLMTSEFYEEMWRQLLDRKQWRGNLQNKKKDGTLYWESANISPIINSKNEITHYLGIKEDITAAKDAEDRLHKFAQDLEWSNWELTTEIENNKKFEKRLLENERKLQRIFEIIPVGINITDEFGNIVDANIASGKILGISKEIQLTKNQSDTDWSIVRPNGSEMHPDEFASVRAMKENRFVKDIVMGVKKSVDDITWINVSAMPLDIEGLGVIIAYIDITTIITTELELKRINENLHFNQLSLEENQFLLNNTIEELENSKHELQELNSTKDKFFSIIAHDLRSPFSGFLGLTKIMSEEIYNISMREVQEYAQTLQESAENLYKLLENLLEWSILQKGNKAFNPEYVNVNFIVKNNFEIYRAKANDKKLILENNIDKNIGVYADNNMLNGILRNLISNAGKFTPENSKITISAIDLAEFVQISVKDEGIGMSEDMLKKIFIIGEKTSRLGTAGEPSTGLGLILVKEYVERNSGKIWAESKEGEGSTFHFTLPKIMD